MQASAHGVRSHRDVGVARPCTRRQYRPSPPGNAGLFARAQAGDQAAWEALFHACYPKVQRVVRRRLNNGPAPPLRRLDRHRQRRLRRARREGVEVPLRDGRRRKEVPHRRRPQARSSTSTAATWPGSATRSARRPQRRPTGGDDWAISSGVPTPSQFAVAEETGREDPLRAPSARRAAASSSSGGEDYNNEEISSETGWPVRQVQRFLEKLQADVPELRRRRR